MNSNINLLHGQRKNLHYPDNGTSISIVYSNCAICNRITHVMLFTKINCLLALDCNDSRKAFLITAEAASNIQIEEEDIRVQKYSTQKMIDMNE